MTLRRSHNHGPAAGPDFYTINDSVRDAVLNKERAKSTSASFLLTESCVGIHMETKNNPIHELLYLSLYQFPMEFQTSKQASTVRSDFKYRKRVLFSLFPELQTQDLRTT